MAADREVRVRMFGFLRAERAQRGLPTEDHVHVPDEGIAARDLAERLELPLDRIEGVFVNHTIHGLGQLVRPGDEIAFVPHGTPGPHRFFLGLYDAGHEDEEEA